MTVKSPRRRLIIPGLLLMGLLTAGPAQGECIDYDHYIRQDGTITTLHTYGIFYETGDLAYGISRDTLQVIDVSDPENPTLVGGCDLGFTPNGIRGTGHRVYAGSGPYRLVVVDASDPQSPAVAGSVVLVNGTSLGFFAYESFAYVFESTGLIIVDATDADNPQVTGNFALGGYPYLVRVDGERAFLFFGDGRMVVLDLAEPSDPTVIADVLLPHSPRNDLAISNQLLAFTDGGGGFQTVDVRDPASPHAGGRIDVHFDATGIRFWGDHVLLVKSGGLMLIDVSDPQTPRWEGTRPNEGGDSVTIKGDVALVHFGGDYGFRLIRLGEVVPILGRLDIPASKMVLADSLAYFLLPSDEVGIYDIRDPMDPRGLGHISRAADFAVSGSLVAILRGAGATELWDVTDPRSPECKGVLESGGSTVSLRGETLYLGGSEFRIASVADPAHPELVAVWSNPSYNFNRFEYIALLDNYAYVLVAYGTRPYERTPFIEVFDVSDPASPSHVGSVSGGSGGPALFQSARGRFIYGVQWDGRLSAFDVTDPTNPILLPPATQRKYDQAGRTAVDGFLYSSGTDLYGSGLQVLDLSDPTSPRPLGEAWIDAPTLDVKIVGDVAYVAAGDSGIYILPAQCGSGHGPLPPFALERPSPQDTIYAVTPTLKWHPVPPGSGIVGPIQYTAHLWREPISSYSEEWVIPAGTDTFCVVGPASLEKAASYTWRVQAESADGRIGSSEPFSGWTFYVGEHEPLPSFALAAPPDQDTLYSLHPTLKWHPIPESSGIAGPIRYTVDITPFPGFANPIQRAAGTDTFYVVENIQLPGHPWYWRVRATSADGRPGVSTPSSGWSFLVAGEYQPCQISAVVMIWGGQVRIAWEVQVAAGLTGFQIFRNNPPHSTQLAPVSPILPPDGIHRFIDEQAQPGVGYRYRVRAFQPDDHYCESELLTVRPPPVPFGVSLSNPGRGMMSATVALPLQRDVSLRVYDLLGREVAHTDLGGLSVGYTPVTWEPRAKSGEPLAGGNYILVFECVEGKETRRWTLVR